MRTKQEHMSVALGLWSVAMENYSRTNKGLPDFRRETARRLIALALRPSGPVLPLRIEPIDTSLPGHGLEAGLHEIAPADHRGLPAAWGFLLALTKTVAAKRNGPIFWPYFKHAYDFGLPHGPGLQHFGFNAGDFLFARCANSLDSLWAMEEALRSGTFAAIIGVRPDKADLTSSRRLQLAAEETQTPIFLIRNWNDANLSAARTRWRISPLPAARDRFGLMRHARWHVALEHARGGGPHLGGGGEWVLEWNHDALCLRLSSLLAGRTAASEEKKKRA